MDEFRGRDLSQFDAVAIIVDGVYPAKESCVVVRHFWPDAVQQECLVHVERGLCGKLSWKHQSEVANLMNRLRAVEGAEAGDEAFEALLSFVKGKNLGAKKSLESRKDVTLSFQRLNVPSPLNVTFLSTNNIENVMRNSRGVSGKVSR